MQFVRMIKNRLTRAVPVKPSRLKLEAPIASFTFDDFAKSAWTMGGQIIEASGGRATYYAAGSLCGQFEAGVRCYDEEDLIAVIENGHEVGCHTFDHKPVPDLSSVISETLSKNAAFVKSITGLPELKSFSYPFGIASVGTKRLLGSKFMTCRGLYPGVNAGWVDFSQLNGISLHRSDLDVERTLKRSGWLIFVGHDVSEEPSPYGCTPKVLENTLRMVSTAGIEILTMSAATQGIFRSELNPRPVPERLSNIS